MAEPTPIPLRGSVEGASGSIRVRFGVGGYAKGQNYFQAFSRVDSLIGTVLGEEYPPKQDGDDNRVEQATIRGEAVLKGPRNRMGEKVTWEADCVESNGPTPGLMTVRVYDTKGKEIGFWSTAMDRLRINPPADAPPG